MSIENEALPIPEEVIANPERSTELIRVWWNDRLPRMIIRPAMQDPAAIGDILAELAWHFSNAYAEKHGMDQAETYKTICDAWTAAHAHAEATRSGDSQ